MNYMNPLLYRYLLEKVAFNHIGAPKKDEIAEKALQNALNFLLSSGGIKEVPAPTHENKLRNLNPFIDLESFPRSVTDLPFSSAAAPEITSTGLPTNPPDLSSLLIPTPADPAGALSLLARVLAGSASKNKPSDVPAAPQPAAPKDSGDEGPGFLRRLYDNLTGSTRQLYDNLTSSDSWKKLLTADHWKGITTADFWKDPATLLTLLALLGTVGGGGYATYRYLSGSSSDKKKKKKSEEAKSAAVRQKAAALRAVLDVIDL
jgi:hypothetical protein